MWLTFPFGASAVAGYMKMPPYKSVSVNVSYHGTDISSSVRLTFSLDRAKVMIIGNRYSGFQKSITHLWVFLETNIFSGRFIPVATSLIL